MESVLAGHTYVFSKAKKIKPAVMNNLKADCSFLVEFNEEIRACV